MFYVPKRPFTIDTHEVWTSIRSFQCGERLHDHLHFDKQGNSGRRQVDISLVFATTPFLGYYYPTSQIDPLEECNRLGSEAHFEFTRALTSMS
jgi:hypothetical protein